MEINRNLANYIQLTSGTLVKNACQSFLKKLGLHYFLYIKQFPDNRRLWLTTHGEWTEHYFKNNYQDISAFEVLKKQPNSGYYLWNTLTGQQVFHDARNLFDIDHGITVIYYLNDSIEFVHLAAGKQDSHIANFYLNSIHYINNFILYFREVGEDLIKIAKKNMLPAHEALSLYSNSEISNITTEKNIDSVIIAPNKEKRLSHHYQNQHITCRELECIELLKKGRTASEIALILRISKRTVEAHIEHIKQKLNCYNVFQLGYLISKIDYYRI